MKSPTIYSVGDRPTYCRAGHKHTMSTSATGISRNERGILRTMKSGSGVSGDSRMHWCIRPKWHYGGRRELVVLVLMMLVNTMCAALPGNELDAPAITDPANGQAAEVITTTEFGECK